MARVRKIKPFGAGQDLSRQGVNPPTTSGQMGGPGVSGPSTTYGGPGVRSVIQGGGSWGPFPEMTSGMTFREVGSSGLRAFSGWVREEFLPELVGRQGARVYREMFDSNAVIGGIMFAIISTMRKVDWRIRPPQDGPENQEMIDFVESLKMDMSHSWEDLVTENLSMLMYGFAPHEIVYKKRMGMNPGPDPYRPGHDLPKSRFDDGRIGWRRLPLRGQDTVIKWFFDENGQVKGMTQQPWIGPLIDIPIEKLLLFRPLHFKGNPEGRSVLRSAYRSYWFTKRIEEQEAISYERLNGFPIVYVPMALMEASKTDSGALNQLNNWKSIATNVRIDEQMGAVMPSDTFRNADGTPSAVRMYDLEFKAPTGASGNRSSSKDVLDRYAVNMMVSVLADFLHLGHAARGTQALANQKADMFFQAVEGFLNANAGVYNRHGLPRLWELNGLDPDTQPTIEPDLAQRVDLDVLSNFVLRLAQSGMPMFPNDELQSYLLDAGGLPDITEPAALEFAGMTDELISNQTDQQLNPPEPPQLPAPPDKPAEQKPKVGEGGVGDTALNKIIRASLARRVIRHGGNRFEMRSKRRWTKRNPTRAERIAKYTNGHADEGRAR